MSRWNRGRSSPAPRSTALRGSSTAEHTRRDDAGATEAVPKAAKRSRRIQSGSQVTLSRSTTSLSRGEEDGEGSPAKRRRSTLYGASSVAATRQEDESATGRGPGRSSNKRSARTRVRGAAASARQVVTSDADAGTRATAKPATRGERHVAFEGLGSPQVSADDRTVRFSARGRTRGAGYGAGHSSSGSVRSSAALESGRGGDAHGASGTGSTSARVGDESGPSASLPGIGGSSVGGSTSIGFEGLSDFYVSDDFDGRSARSGGVGSEAGDSEHDAGYGSADTPPSGVVPRTTVTARRARQGRRHKHVREVRHSDAYDSAGASSTRSGLSARSVASVRSSRMTLRRRTRSDSALREAVTGRVSDGEPFGVYGPGLLFRDGDDESVPHNTVIDARDQIPTLSDGSAYYSDGAQSMNSATRHSIARHRVRTRGRSRQANQQPKPHQVSATIHGRKDSLEDTSGGALAPSLRSSTDSKPFPTTVSRAGSRDSPSGGDGGRSERSIESSIWGRVAQMPASLGESGGRRSRSRSHSPHSVLGHRDAASSTQRGGLVRHHRRGSREEVGEHEGRSTAVSDSSFGRPLTPIIKGTGDDSAGEHDRVVHFAAVSADGAPGDGHAPERARSVTFAIDADRLRETGASPMLGSGTASRLQRSRQERRSIVSNRVVGSSRGETVRSRAQMRRKSGGSVRRAPKRGSRSPAGRRGQGGPSRRHARTSMSNLPKTQFLATARVMTRRPRTNYTGVIPRNPRSGACVLASVNRYTSQIDAVGWQLPCGHFESGLPCTNRRLSCPLHTHKLMSTAAFDSLDARQGHDLSAGAGRSGSAALPSTPAWGGSGSGNTRASSDVSHTNKSQGVGDWGLGGAWTAASLRQTAEFKQLSQARRLLQRQLASARARLQRLQWQLSIASVDPSEVAVDDADLYGGGDILPMPSVDLSRFRKVRATVASVTREPAESDTVARAAADTTGRTFVVSETGDSHALVLEYPAGTHTPPPPLPRQYARSHWRPHRDSRQAINTESPGVAASPSAREGSQPDNAESSGPMTADALSSLASVAGELAPLDGSATA